jgi:negative regulator of flagellin synthesis FlgM
MGEGTREREREVSKVAESEKRMFELLEMTPEVRKDKIEALKNAVREGTYQVKAEDIAEKILKEWVQELAALEREKESP